MPHHPWPRRPRYRRRCRVCLPGPGPASRSESRQAKDGKKLKCCGGATCKGRCKCVGGKKRCGAKCIPDGNCCADTDCGTGGAVCTDGQCDCPDGERDCLGTCIPNADCCDTDCSLDRRCCGNSCRSITTPTDCGACDNRCPGFGTTQAEVTCTDPDTRTCSFACRGENYDVDGNPNNGCEVQDDPLGNHTQGTARSRGSRSCEDGASQDSFSGLMVSDARNHIPSVSGFSSTTGSAPDWWTVFADGGTFCQNDLQATIRTSGGSSTGTCYRLTVRTNQQERSVDISGNNSSPVAVPTMNYSDDTPIFFRIEKTCPASQVRERVTYTVSYHL